MDVLGQPHYILRLTDPDKHSRKPEIDYAAQEDGALYYLWRT